MTLPKHILDQFTDWYKQAQNLPSLTYPNAMMLATGGVENRVSARIVLLKEYDAQGFVFYTNYHGRKSVELLENPYAALTFYWEKIGKQIRIEGNVEKVSEAQSDKYFSTRPRDSQIGAWASEQSEPLASREALEERIKEYEFKFSGQNVPRPPNWGGWRVLPDMVEFWQEADFRLHQRDVWKLVDGKWTHELLNP